MQASSSWRGIVLVDFFLDIDGTILPFGKDIPKSALDVFSEAKALGHKIFFATGRSQAEITPTLASLGFDGGVYSAGATVIYKDKVIYERYLNEKEKDYVFEFASEHKLDLVVQTEEATYMHSSTYELWKELFLHYIGREIAIGNLVVSDTFPDSLVLKKLVIFSRDGMISKAREDLDKAFTIVGNTVGLPQSIVAELVLSDITKATGIEHMINYLGDKRESTVAIGDGPNDIEMIEYASIGIAMGNGCEELKSKADYITTDIENDGLKNAFSYAINKLC